MVTSQVTFCIKRKLTNEFDTKKKAFDAYKRRKIYSHFDYWKNIQNYSPDVLYVHTYMWRILIRKSVSCGRLLNVIWKSNEKDFIEEKKKWQKAMSKKVTLYWKLYGKC